MKLTRLVPIALVLCAFTLASCANTVRGVGRDVKVQRTPFRKRLNKASSSASKRDQKSVRWADFLAQMLRTFGSKIRYFFIFTHYPTQNRFALLLEML